MVARVWQVCRECLKSIRFGDVARAEWCEPELPGSSVRCQEDTVPNKVVWQCGSCVYDYEVLNDLEW